MQEYSLKNCVPVFFYCMLLLKIIFYICNNYTQKQHFVEFNQTKHEQLFGFIAHNFHSLPQKVYLIFNWAKFLCQSPR